MELDEDRVKISGSLELLSEMPGDLLERRTADSAACARASPDERDEFDIIAFLSDVDETSDARRTCRRIDIELRADLIDLPAEIVDLRDDGTEGVGLLGEAPDTDSHVPP